MTRTHIAIRKRKFCSPDPTVLVQASAVKKPVPWGRIEPGERVYLKWSREPIVQRSAVARVEYVEYGTLGELHDLTKGLELYSNGEYWNTLHEPLWGLVVYLEDQERTLDWLFAP